MSEQWRRIGGTIYEVSDRGRVRSLDRYVQSISKGGVLRWHRKAGKVLVTSTNGKGYHHISLCVGGRKHTRKVHRLVAAAFLGPRPEGMVTDHIDRDRENNHVSNLRYITGRENLAHVYLERERPCSLLHRESGVVYHADSQTKLALLLGLHTSEVNMVVSGKRLSAKGYVRSVTSLTP